MGVDSGPGPRRDLSRALARALVADGGWDAAALSSRIARVAPAATPAWIDALTAHLSARFGADPRPRPLVRTVARFIQDVITEVPAEDDELEEDDALDADPRDEDAHDLEAPRAPEPPTEAELAARATWHALAVTAPQPDPTVIHVAAMVPARGAPETWRVPPITSLGALAELLGLGVLDLDDLADVRRASRRVGLGPLRHYAVEVRAKPAGGRRVIEGPKPLLKRVQRRILHRILDHVPPHDAAHGFVHGRSALTHARLHAGREVVLRFDLRDFFATVHDGLVLALFRTAGYPESIARALVGLTTHALSTRALRELEVDVHGPLGQHLRRAHLPQGAPTSPAIANLAAFRLDVRLAGLARALGARYSRYADDLVLSGDRRLGRHVAGIEARVGAIAQESGFALHHAKTRLRPRSTRQVVGGWVVNARPALARDAYDRLRAILHDAIHHGPRHANRAGHPDFAAFLAGSIAHVAEASPRRGEVLRALAARIRW